MRFRLNLRPVTSDYSYVSQESYILLLLKYVKDAQDRSKMNFQARPEFSERWNILKQYKCDPWNEFKLLEQTLKVEYKIHPENTKTLLFDLGRSNNVRHFKTNNTEVFSAFNFLKFVEDVGIPFKIPRCSFDEKSAMGAIERLSEVAPYWSLSTMLRIGDSKAVDKMFNRGSLLKMRQDDVDSLIRNYIKLFEKVVLSNNLKGSGQKKLLMSVIPELLSRLISKCSSIEKKEVFKLLIEIYKSNAKIQSLNVKKLTERLVTSLSEEEILDYLPELIKFEIDDIDSVLPNPFKFTLYINEKHIEIQEGYIIDLLKFDELIESIKNGSLGKRKLSIRILSELKRFGLLDQKQEKAFIDAMWLSLDQKGFPDNIEHYKFAICRDMCPDNIQGKELIKKYILDEESISQKQSLDKSLKMSGGHVPLCNEIIGASQFVEWTSDEAHIIFNKLLYWWDLDKEFLHENRFEEIREEFEKRFQRLRMSLIKAVSTSFNPDQDILALKNMVSEMKEYGLPVCSIKCAFSHIIPEWKKQLIFDVSNAYFDLKSSFIEDAIEGMYSIFNKKNESLYEDVIEHSLSLLASSLRLRDKHRLLFSLFATFEIISKYKLCFSKSLEDSVIFSLDKLKVETNGLSDSFELESTLYLRENSAKLAYQLYEYYREEKIEIPEVICQWKEICMNPDEFVEIRNSWVK